MSYKPTFQASEFHKPSRHYEIDINGSKILVAHIRKNASTALKNLHRNENSKIIKAKKGDSEKYSRRIFIYRDPLDRFISAFLNKFVNDSQAADIKRNFLELTSLQIEAMKFTDYIDYSHNDFSKLDCHLRTQKSHLWKLEYDTPININDLHKSMCKHIGHEKSDFYFSKKINVSSHNDKLIDASLTNKNIVELRELQSEGYALKPSNFLSTDLENYIKRKYQADYDMIAEIQSQG